MKKTLEILNNTYGIYEAVADGEEIVITPDQNINWGNVHGPLVENFEVQELLDGKGKRYFGYYIGDELYIVKNTDNYNSAINEIRIIKD